MKQQTSSIWNADIGFVVLLAAMVVVGGAALLQDREPSPLLAPATLDATQYAGSEAAIVPYRIEVIGVRPKETAQQDVPQTPAQARTSG